VRSLAGSFALALALVLGLLPCERCAPVAGGARAATVVLGQHAHEAKHACCGHEGCSGPEEPRHAPDVPDAPDVPGVPTPPAGHGPSCCEHSPSDPGAPPMRVVLEPFLADAGRLAVLGAEGVVWQRRLEASADAPVPRSPTETVVLLR
jgi:hypothetical protein